MTNKKTVQLFFTVDDNYVQFLSTTIASIVAHSSNKYKYHLRIIHDGLSLSSKRALKKFQDNKKIFIHFTNVTVKIHSISVKLDVRDYYTITTYYRLFLPTLFPTISKGLYLDSDIVVNEDIAKLYFVDLKNNLLGAVPDSSVQLYEEFSNYVTKVIEMDHTKYFNAGVLLMNFKELRKFSLERKAINLLRKVTFKVAQDQDLLNYLCKNRTLLLDYKWNTMPLGDRCDNPYLIHYNLMFKPWNLKDIMYEEYFYEYAQKAGVYDEIIAHRNEIPLETINKILNSVNDVKNFCNQEALKADEYHKKIHGDKKKEKAKTINQKIKNNEIDVPNISKERQRVLDKIRELELSRQFDVDVENDPPFRHLMPGDVDYLRKKFTSKIKTMWANHYSFAYFKHQIKKGRIIIDGYEGIENLKKVKSGAIITSNHFSPFDSVPIHLIVKKIARHKKLFKIIREGNYTMPGLYGFFLRNCNTLPLAVNPIVMKDLYKSIGIILKKKNFILIYPEQSMWWNYRKPKPLKQGAFHFAAKNNVPIIPMFITMRDTSNLDQDGYPIQAYTLHILEPIYPDNNLPFQETTKKMKDENESKCREIYEKVYNTKLTYLSEEK